MKRVRQNNKDTSSKIPNVGVGCYTKDQWFKLQAVAADPEILEKTYEEWVEVFNKGCANLKEVGIMAVKVSVDVDELIEWCKENKLAINGEARSQFVARKLRKIKIR